MFAKKKIEIFTEINNQRDFDKTLKENKKKLVCAEIYSSVFGPCCALERAVYTKFKFEWDEKQVCAFLRVQCDEIEVFERFVGHSIPFFMILVYKNEPNEWRVKRVFLGVDAMKFEAMALEELQYYTRELNGYPDERHTYALDEATPAEIKWTQLAELERKQEKVDVENRQALRQAARKRHRAELMVPYLKHLNFVLFWPHMKHAHVELYERWDEHNIIMVGREELQLDEDTARDILYGGDAPTNPAAMFALLSGPALAICFRALDQIEFVPLVRHILYQPPDEEEVTKEGTEKKRPNANRISAYDHYKTYSPTRQQIWQMRREAKEQKKIDKKFKRDRLLAEKKRIARQAIAEELQAMKVAKENKKMEYLKAGNLEEMDRLNEEPEPTEEDVDIVVPEELSDPEDEESEVEENEDEYFPPAGLVVPGFYAPPNDVAKANGLAVLFPRHVMENVTPQPEFLPPHVLVMLDINKRHKVITVITPYKYSIIHLGIFKARTPYDSHHIAYSVKQFDALGEEANLEELKLCFMVSTVKDFGVLCLMDLSPIHVSRDNVAGEDECAALFGVDYADDYPEFEDFEENEE